MSAPSRAELAVSCEKGLLLFADVLRLLGRSCNIPCSSAYSDMTVTELEARKYRVLLQLWGAMPLKNVLVLFACALFPAAKMASPNISAEDVTDFFTVYIILQCFGWLRYYCEFARHLGLS